MRSRSSLARPRRSSSTTSTHPSTVASSTLRWLWRWRASEACVCAATSRPRSAAPMGELSRRSHAPCRLSPRSRGNGAASTQGGGLHRLRWRDGHLHRHPLADAERWRGLCVGGWRRRRGLHAGERVPRDGEQTGRDASARVRVSQRRPQALLSIPCGQCDGVVSTGLGTQALVCLGLPTLRWLHTPPP
jgi:hypothetical protein